MNVYLQKGNRDKEFLSALQKIQTLDKLCRALQEERTQMQEQLKRSPIQENPSQDNQSQENQSQENPSQENPSQENPTQENSLLANNEIIEK